MILLTIALKKVFLKSHLLKNLFSTFMVCNYVKIYFYSLIFLKKLQNIFFNNK